MGLNKKGFVFSLIAILVVAAAVLFSIAVNTGTRDDGDAKEERVRTIQNFIDITMKDAGEATAIAAYNAMLSLQFDITANNDYSSTPESELGGLTANGSFQGFTPELMNESSIVDWQDRIIFLGHIQNVDVDFVGEPDVEVSQSDHWYVDFRYRQEVRFADKRSGSLWVEQVDTTERIAITNFYDPLGARNGYLERIQRPNSTANTQDFIDLPLFIIASNTAPSYLDRLEGDYDAQSDQGIESLVPRERLQNEFTISRDSNSIQDWRFFGEINLTTDYCLAEAGNQLSRVEIGIASEYGISC